MGKEPINYKPIDKALRQQAMDKLAMSPYTSNAQIARDHGVSVSSVEKRKKLLAKAQVMQEAADICRNDERGTKKRPKGTRGNASPFHDALQRAASSDDAEDFFQTYAEHRILTPEESMRLMSGMACDPNIPPQVRTSADAALDKLRVRHAPKETLGPGPPLTPKDKFSRLLAVIEACPPAVLEQVFAIMHFPTPEEVDERIIVVDPIVKASGLSRHPLANSHDLNPPIPDLGSVPTFHEGELIVTNSRESMYERICPNCNRTQYHREDGWRHDSFASVQYCAAFTTGSERGSHSSPKPKEES